MICEQFKRMPPWACRVLARKNSRWQTTALTNREIATIGGLSVRNVIRISKLKQWNRVPLETIEKFTRGCGIDILRPGKHLEYLRRYRLRYLLKSNPKTKSAIMALINQAALKS